LVYFVASSRQTSSLAGVDDFGGRGMRAASLLWVVALVSGCGSRCRLEYDKTVREGGGIAAQLESGPLQTMKGGLGSSQL